MNIAQMMQVYCDAVVPAATCAEALDWWRELQGEAMAVIATPTKATAASVLYW